MTVTVSTEAVAAPERPQLDARTRHLLEAPIVPLLLGMAWPNIVIMVTQASTGLIETWWIAKLGTDALAGMALVFPPVIMMTMISAGAIGGGISSAIARALGSGQRERADGLVLHAVVINLVLGILFSFVFLLFGRAIYRGLGGAGAELDAALAYSNVIFTANIFIWVMNGLASVIRGTGNMWFPATVIFVGAFFLVQVSPLLIFGFGPIPPLGVAGGGFAIAIYNIAGMAAMAWYVLSGRTTVRFRWVRLNLSQLTDILRVGAVSAVMSILTNVIIAGATSLVASAGNVGAIAGFGTGARLEYLLVPLIFGIGAPLVALVGTNIGAGQRERALKIGFAGGALAFLLTEAIGIAAAIWPQQWLLLFSTEPDMISAGSAYLRIVGPVYGFFGLGLALYFASQGAGRVLWPLAVGFLRFVIAIGGGWIALRLTGSVNAIFVALAIGMSAYGVIMTIIVRSGYWFR
jgi:putative MATE family efflux protein